MIDLQSAKATDNALILQSARDTNIGYSASDMKGIMESLADQLPKFAVLAHDIVERRLDSFRDEIISRFENDTATRIDAFGDPDFQYTLNRAQHAYARSGDENISEILVDLIAQRSKEIERTRLSLTLNDSIDRSAFLTRNEFAELSLVFWCRHTSRRDINSLDYLIESIRNTTEPLLDDVSREYGSYQYLEGQSCASMDFLSAVDLYTSLTKKFGGVMSKGAPKKNFEESLGDGCMEKYPNVLQPCVNNPENYQAWAISLEVLKGRLKEYDLEDKADTVWQIHSQGMLSQAEFIERASGIYPRIAELFDLWQSTPLRSLKLTSIGIAIGYANLTRICDFKAELGVWIK